MKGILVPLVITCLSLPLLSAQDNKFEVGDQVVNAGIGYGNILYSGHGFKSNFLTVSLSYEKGQESE